jgi:hypothetical protein
MAQWCSERRAPTGAPRAADAGTRPEFFTLYETSSFQVLQGSDYLARLNDPTDWTRAATAHFRTTTRSLTRVVASHGVGPGGALLTVALRYRG